MLAELSSTGTGVPAAVLRRISSFARRHPIVGVGIVLLVAPVIALAVYAGAAYWLLSGPRLRSLINQHPKSFALNYSQATSFRPGRIAVRNLTIRGSDHNVEWIIRLADARIEYSVLALAARTFRCTGLRGSGLSFRLRSKLEPARLDTADTTNLPPIPGFAEPPLREPAGAPRPHPKNPWRVEVRAIRIRDLNEIWIDTTRYRGPARVAGSFVLRPGLLAEIGPARVDFEGGEVRLGGVPNGLTVSGSIEARFAPYEPHAVRGSEVWRTVSGEVDLDAGFDDLRALRHLIRSAAHTRLGEGSGKVTVRGTISGGNARGRAHVSVEDGAVRLEKVALEADAEISMVVADWNLVDGPLDVSGSRVAFKEVRSSGSDPSRNWWGRFEIASGRIGSISSASVRARSRDARPLLAMLGVKLPGWTRGLLSLEDFAASADVAIGPSSASVRHLQARGGDFRIQGHYSRDRRSRAGALLIESGVLSVGLDIQAASTRLVLFGPKKWYRESRQTPARPSLLAPPHAGASAPLPSETGGS
jgi:hypothetical protein